MQIVTVIPISKGVFKESLSYFSKDNLPAGSIVSVYIRGKKTNAVVVKNEPAILSKTELKAADFTLKKINEIKSKAFFDKTFIQAIERTSVYHAAPLGSVLQSFAPKTLLSFFSTVALKRGHESKKSNLNLKTEKNVFQASEKERLYAYRNLIREEFARGKSVFFCLPTIEDIKKIFWSLRQGIEKYSVELHSELSSKETSENYHRLFSLAHPVAIFSTPFFLSLPRHDISTIVIERESSPAYKQQNRPFIDTRLFAEFLAEEAGQRLILGDLALRVETLHRYAEKEFNDFTTISFKSLGTVSGSVISHEKDHEGKWRALSKEVLALVELTRREKGRLFILAGRRGLYPITVCNDCGTVRLCEHCSSPVVLHSGKQKRFFLCHKCGRKTELGQNKEAICDECRGWHLVPLGFGTEKIAEELEKEFPGLKIFRIDSDNTKTHGAIEKTRDDFYKTPDSVLIGTELALPYLKDKVHSSAVAGFDGILTIPDFRIEERLFHALMYLREKTKKTFLIQTKRKELPLFEHVIRGDILSFYRNELENRRKFAYPPFETLIKITWRGKRDRAPKKDALGKIFDGYKIDIFPSFIEEIKKEYRLNLLLRISPKRWPDEKLLNILKNLPPEYYVDVGPTNLL